MQNSQYPFTSSSFEYSEQLPQATDDSHADLQGEQQTLDTLMSAGFGWEEAVKLLHLREHLYENEEMRQRVSEDVRMHFARWLYEQGEIFEEGA